jgi:hypothetical protein
VRVRAVGSILLALGLALTTDVAAEAATTERTTNSRFRASSERRQQARERARRAAAPTRRASTVASSVAQTSPPAPRILQDSQLVNRDGSWCVELSPPPPEWGEDDSLAAFGRFTQNVYEAQQLGATDPICPGEPGAEAAPAPSADAVLAMLWEEHVDLPSPTLSGGPARGITGLPVFLEIGGARQETYTFEPADALGYRFVIEVDSVYDIDWGDGHVDRGVASQGGAWPNGDVTHTYQYRDHANVITVTQRWTARWTATGWGAEESGTIDDLWTSANLALPIWEVQAVVEG